MRAMNSSPGGRATTSGQLVKFSPTSPNEIATAWRYRQMVEHSGIQLTGFDQDLWARVGDYASRVPQESLAPFRLLRGANLHFLEQLTAEQWECFGIHSERGRITVRDLG